jgi:hypothetical protein
MFLRKKKGKELTKAGIGTRGPARTSSSFGGTTTAWAGNSSSSGVTEGPYRTGTSSSFGGTTTVMGYNSKTSSSSSLTCAMPNSSFIVSNVIYKNHNIPK